MGGLADHVTPARLIPSGISAGEAPAKAALFQRTLDALGSAREAARLFYIPGRLEFLGKHTDYCGGRSMICAVERAICLAATPRGDQIVRLIDADTGNGAEFAIDP